MWEDSKVFGWIHRWVRRGYFLIYIFLSIGGYIMAMIHGRVANPEARTDVVGIDVYLRIPIYLGDRDRIVAHSDTFWTIPQLAFRNYVAGFRTQKHSPEKVFYANNHSLYLVL